jgi:hypothetical protein
MKKTLSVEQFFEEHPTATFLLEKESYTVAPCKSGEIDALYSIAKYLCLTLKLPRQGVTNVEQLVREIFFQWRGKRDIGVNITYIAGSESEYHPMYNRAEIPASVKCSFDYAWGAKSYEEYLEILQKKQKIADAQK